MYLHQKKDWPNFTWNEAKVALALAEVNFLRGKVLGKIEGMGLLLKKEAGVETLTAEVVRSSEVEGETLQFSEVRFSISRRLGVKMQGLVESSKKVDGIVEMLYDAVHNYNAPLTQ